MKHLLVDSQQYKTQEKEKKSEICLKLTMKHRKDATDVALVFLLLNLNIFHAFF